MPYRLASAFLLAAATLACGARSELTAPTVEEDVEPPPEASRCVSIDLTAGPDYFFDVTFVAQIRSADVFFLVDVTGSMAEEIDVIGRTLSEEIVVGLAETLVDARFGVGRFADFPAPGGNYGRPGDEVFRLLSPMTADVEAVQAAVDALPLRAGGDHAEALVEALYQTATGEGHGGYLEPADCVGGRVGYPCFRRDAVPIVLAFTDAPSHNAPGGHDSYARGAIVPEPHDYPQTLAAMRRIGARVLGLYSGSVRGRGLTDLRTIARDTGAIDADGEPIVVPIGFDGSELGPSVIEVVRTLVTDARFDVSLAVDDVTVDDPPPILGTEMIEEVRAIEALPDDGAVLMGEEFVDVVPGTQLWFRIFLRYDLVDDPRVRTHDGPLRALVRVRLLQDGLIPLATRVIAIELRDSDEGSECEEG